MNPLRLKAFAASGHGWSLYVKEPESGLILPVIRDTFTIRIENRHAEAVLVMDCQIDINPRDDKFLKLKTSDTYLVCEQGFINLFGPFVVDDTLITCTIMLDGFAEETI